MKRGIIIGTVASFLIGAAVAPGYFVVYQALVGQLNSGARHWAGVVMLPLPMIMIGGAVGSAWIVGRLSEINRQRHHADRF
jgi:hypothetical protein